MARTGKGKNARPSNMPAMVTRLEDRTIFDYLDLIERHRTRPDRPTFTQLSTARVARRPTRFEVSIGHVSPAAVWLCPGCGKTLVSAVHQAANPPSYMFCTRKCREETQHGKQR